MNTFQEMHLLVRLFVGVLLNIIIIAATAGIVWVTSWVSGNLPAPLIELFYTSLGIWMIGVCSVVILLVITKEILSTISSRQNKQEFIPREIESTEPVPRVIESREPIYRSIEKNLTSEGILPAGFRLPDQDEVDALSDGVPMQNGYLDGILAPHTRHQEIIEEAQTLAELIMHVIETDSIESKESLRTAIESNFSVHCIEPMMKELSDRGVQITRPFHLYLWALMHESSNRTTVKFAILLLGEWHDIHETEESTGLITAIKTLAKDNEFTLYCVNAINLLSKNPEKDIWEMAQSVRGHGRIHTVHELRDTANPEIQEWILREGYKNDVTYVELAPIAAETGQMHKRLQQDNLDQELLISIAEVLKEIIPDGVEPQVLSLYIKHVADSDSLTHFYTLTEIQGFLKSAQARDWDPEIVSDMLQSIEQITGQERWIAVTQQALQSYYLALYVAEYIGLEE